MDIMKFFIADSKQNDNTTKEIDFLQRLKQIDEKLLAESNETNYSLETDSSFENCNKEKLTGCDFELFDNSLDNYNFTNINRLKVNVLGEFGTNKIKPMQIFTFDRVSDSIGKFSLRLKLKQSCSKESFGTILNLLADASAEIEIGGSTYFKIPKLLLVYLICSELKTNIEYLDAEVFNSTYSKDEIKSMIKTQREEAWVYTNKYYFKSGDSRYLDIPLLDQFLSYDMPIPLIATQYQNTTFKLTIPLNSIAELEKYIESIHLISENICYVSSKYRKQMALKSHELVKMNFSMDYFHSYTSQTLNRTYGENFQKFMFVFIRPSSSNQDITKTDLPTIQSVEIHTIEKFNKQEKNITYTEKNITYTIEQSNMYLAEYDNIYVYGIALDGQSNMKNWVGILNECNNLYKSLAKSTDSITNLDTWASTQAFKCVFLERYKINLSSYSIPVNIEVFVGSQNIQRVMSGMSCQAFSS